ncbi:MAG: tetratricopeptide repeat protein [Piscinibacter sp.]|nr:tetratricopeptide repeat protein [Piscinibacter sp.]
METSAHTFSAALPPRLRRASPAVSEALVGAALAAHKAGTLDDWLRRHPRVTRWLLAHWLGPLLAAAGEAPREGGTAAAAALLLRWAVLQLRPDRGAEGDPIGRSEWLDRTSWRPMLALWCQFGFGTVPAFRDRYHGHADEPAASHLCGLWSVGASTYYRYLDKGKRSLAGLLREGPAPADRLGLRELALARTAAAPAAPAERHAWHGRLAQEALGRHDASSALWHWLRSGDVAGFIRVLQRHSVELANDGETELLVAGAADLVQTPRERFDLLLAQAALYRMRGASEPEQQAYEQALRLAADADDALMLGIVYGALGKFHEPRDLDRAFACYQDSADCLWRSGIADDRAAAAPIVEEYVATLVKLAWLYVLRNDPRGKAVLERAAQLRDRHPLSVPALAMLEQTWGEYWRRAGDGARALEHKHRALNLYERIADHQAILKTCGNLALIYGEARDFERAIAYSQRVLSLAATLTVEPEIVASTHLNLGVAYFWQGDYEPALREYQAALDIALRAQLRLVVRRAHYNLAEVHYIRFKASRDPQDEARGDAHAAAALAAWPEESDPAHVQATKSLKREVLGPGNDRAYDRLLPQEFAAHHAQMAEIQRQRELLAVPVGPEQHVRAYLAIANAYLAISVREREAALALIEKHGLGSRFADELDGLRRTFDRQLTREQRLAAAWRAATADLLSAQRCTALVEHLLADGALNKSRYAELCGLSPATASKHLGLLAERGLLAQSGKGPSTRYTLPA